MKMLPLACILCVPLETETP